MAFAALKWTTLLGVAVFAHRMSFVFIHWDFMGCAIAVAKFALLGCAVEIMIECDITSLGLHHDLLTSTGYDEKHN